MGCLCQQVSERTSLGFGFELGRIGGGTRKQGFALDWMLPGSRDNSRSGRFDNCYLEGGNNGAKP